MFVILLRIPSHSLHLQPHGIFVTFYNGVTGLVSAAEAGVAVGESLASKFHVGQVKVCRVLHADAENKKIALSFLVGSLFTPNF